MKLLVALLSICFLVSPYYAVAQSVTPDTVVTMKARVLQVLSTERKDVPGTSVQSNYQSLEVQIIDGPEAGEDAKVDNDFLDLHVGDVFYLIHTTNSLDGTDFYGVSEPYRLPAVALICGLFVAVVLFFGGKQGLRGLISLGASFAFILFLLLPALLKGYSPILVSVGVA